MKTFPQHSKTTTESNLKIKIQKSVKHWRWQYEYLQEYLLSLHCVLHHYAILSAETLPVSLFRQTVAGGGGGDKTGMENKRNYGIHPLISRSFSCNSPYTTKVAQRSCDYPQHDISPPYNRGINLKLCQKKSKYLGQNARAGKVCGGHTRFENKSLFFFKYPCGRQALESGLPHSRAPRRP